MILFQKGRFVKNGLSEIRKTAPRGRDWNTKPDPSIDCSSQVAGFKQHVSHGERDALLQTELVVQLSQTTQHTAGECRCNAYNQRARAWAIVFRVFNVIGVTDRDNTDKTAPDSPLNDSSTRRAIRSLTLTVKFHKLNSPWCFDKLQSETCRSTPVDSRRTVN